MTKKAIIEQVENGFILSLYSEATDQYLMHVASNEAEAVAILNTYFV